MNYVLEQTLPPVYDEEALPLYSAFRSPSLYEPLVKTPIMDDQSRSRRQSTVSPSRRILPFQSECEHGHDSEDEEDLTETWQTYIHCARAAHILLIVSGVVGWIIIMVMVNEERIHKQKNKGIISFIFALTCTVVMFGFNKILMDIVPKKRKGLVLGFMPQRAYSYSCRVFLFILGGLMGMAFAHLI
jgi:hypothetical protein